MRRKRIQEFANNTCQMFVGWGMHDDLKLLAGLPDGLIKVDMLTGEAEHDKKGSIKLHIAREIQAWLKEQFDKVNIPLSAITSAKLNAEIKTNNARSYGVGPSQPYEKMDECLKNGPILALECHF